MPRTSFHAHDDRGDAVQAGQPVADLIPVNVPPTKEYAAMLHSRLQFLREKVLSEYREDLID